MGSVRWLWTVNTFVLTAQSRNGYSADRKRAGARSDVSSIFIGLNSLSPGSHVKYFQKGLEIRDIYLVVTAVGPKHLKIRELAIICDISNITSLLQKKQ